MIREMNQSDYDEVYTLWKKIKGFAIRSVDDSRSGIERFLKRNPHTSVVACLDGKIVGSILCGQDGRRACLYHVCVDPDYRMRGIGNREFCRKCILERAWMDTPGRPELL